MVMKRGTRTDMMPKADVPLVTATAPRPGQEELAKLGITGDISFAGGSRVRQTEEVPQERRLEQPEVFRDSVTGLPSGIVTTSGSTFLGLSPGDVERVAEGERRKAELPAGTQLVGTQAQQLAEQQRMADIAGRIGVDPTQSGMMGQGAVGQAPQVDMQQALLAGGLDAITGGAALGGLKFLFGAAAAGAASGAKAGAILGPKGIVAGVVIGAAGGFITGTLRNIASQKSGEISGLRTNLSQNERSMREAIAFMNLDPANAEQYVDIYNQARNKIVQDYGSLNMMTQQKLSLALSKDGPAVKYRYESFLSDAGMGQMLDQKAALSMGAPNAEQGMMMLSSISIGGEE